MEVINACDRVAPNQINWLLRDHSLSGSLSRTAEDFVDEEVIEIKKEACEAVCEKIFHVACLSYISPFLSQQLKDEVESFGHIPCSSQDSTPLWAELGVSTRRSVLRPETPAVRQKK